jgi:BirA family biotin operon repressor/biotin-[acetyl-CoA-carboxylase] ligase
MKVNWIELETIDSTNAYVKREKERFDPNALTCITANGQTSGKGQFGRTWHSPPGVNIYATLFFYTPLDTHLTQIPQLLAKTLIAYLQTLHLPAIFKHPNDVLIHGKKVAGILCETSFEEEKIAVILGMGINVNMEPKELESIDKLATSLRIEAGKSFNKKKILHHLVELFLAALRD